MLNKLLCGFMLTTTCHMRLGMELSACGVISAFRIFLDSQALWIRDAQPVLCFYLMMCKLYQTNLIAVVFIMPGFDGFEPSAAEHDGCWTPFTGPHSDCSQKTRISFQINWSRRRWMCIYTHPTRLVISVLHRVFTFTHSFFGFTLHIPESQPFGYW